MIDALLLLEDAHFKEELLLFIYSLYCTNPIISSFFFIGKNLPFLVNFCLILLSSFIVFVLCGDKYKYFGLLYLVNPIVWLSAYNVGLIDLLWHVTLLVLVLLHKKGMIVCGFFLAIFISLINPIYFSLLPVILTSLIRKYSKIDHTQQQDSVLAIILNPTPLIVISFTGLSVLIANYVYSVRLSEKSIELYAITELLKVGECSLSVLRTTAPLEQTLIEYIYKAFSIRYAGSELSIYLPGIGVWWYLRAECFTQYAVYFRYLQFHQPFILSTGVALRLWDMDVCVQSTIMLVIILYFSTSSMMSLSLIICLLAVHSKYFLAIRNVWNILLCIVVLCIASAVSFKFWIIQGSFNANFLFFEGLAMWVLLAVLIIEFISAVLREEALKYESNEKKTV